MTITSLSRARSPSPLPCDRACAAGTFAGMGMPSRGLAAGRRPPRRGQAQIDWASAAPVKAAPRPATMLATAFAAAKKRAPSSASRSVS